MSDFMKWFYTQYIKPQLDAVPQDDYEFYFSSFFEELSFNGEKSYEKVQEFNTIHAFLLDLRTGRGLPRD